MITQNYICMIHAGLFETARYETPRNKYHIDV